MAKVGRAAYAASRARLEVVTASKTLNKNESGELYAIDAGGAVVITLPTDPENGTRYSFWIIDDVTGGTVTIQAAAADAFQGSLSFADDDTDAHIVVVKADGVTTDDDLITLAADTDQGSWIDVVYDKDNTRWLVCGIIHAATAPTFSLEQLISLIKSNPPVLRSRGVSFIFNN